MLAVLCATTALGGCIGSNGRTTSPAELAQERSDFLLLADGLRSVRTAVASEVGAARSAWPSLANGLPSSPPSSLQRLASAASARAGAIGEPAFMKRASRLTGPAAGLAGLYESFARLCERGWRLTAASIASIMRHGAPRAANFARANSALYIDAIYDAHYDLSLIAKALTRGYEKLGGERAFANRLPAAQVRSLASAYSIPAVRLTPHPGKRAEAQ